MSCGANHNRRVDAALKRRSKHVAAVGRQKAKHKAVARPPKRTAWKPGKKKKGKKRSEASLKASATARKHARATARAHARATARAHARATASAHARATARAHARAKLRADALRRHLEELACHNRRRRSAPGSHHNYVPRTPAVRLHIRAAKPVTPRRPWAPRRLAAPLDPKG